MNSTSSSRILNHQKVWLASKHRATALPGEAQPCSNCHTQGGRGIPRHHVCTHLLRLATPCRISLCVSHPPQGGVGSLRQGLGFPYPTSQHSTYNLRIRHEMGQCSFPNLRVIPKVLYLGCARYKTGIRMAPWINKWGTGWSEDFPEFSKLVAMVEGRRKCDVRCFSPQLLTVS